MVSFFDFLLFAVVVGFGLGAAMRFALRMLDITSLAEDEIDALERR